MNGPKIIAMPAPETPEPLRSPDEGKTGIRRGSSGWYAIIGGRLVGEWSGLGSKLAAIRAAGTNEVLS